MLTTITMITVLCGKINNYCTLKEPTYLLLSNISCNIYLHVHLPFFHQNWFQNSINVHTVNFRLWMGWRGGADQNTSWIYSLFKLPRFIIKNQIYLCFWLHVPLDGPITWGLISGGGRGEGGRGGGIKVDIYSIIYIVSWYSYAILCTVLLSDYKPWTFTSRVV